jgi:hypothetical protein
VRVINSEPSDCDHAKYQDYYSKRLRPVEAVSERRFCPRDGGNRCANGDGGPRNPAAKPFAE